MTGQKLSDELPLAYQQEYGDLWLEDKEQVQFDDRTESYVRRYAEKVVAELTRLHHIKNNI